MTGTADVQAVDRGKPYIRALHNDQAYDVSDADGARLCEAGLAYEGDPQPAAKAIAAPPEDKGHAPDEDKAASETPPNKRAAKGKCPTCKRTFADLDRHQERQGH